MKPPRPFPELPALACAFGPTLLESTADDAPPEVAGRLRDASSLWRRRFVSPFLRCVWADQVDDTLARVSCPFIEFALEMPATLEPLVGGSPAAWRSALRRTAARAAATFPAPSPPDIDALWYHDVAWCTEVMARRFFPWLELAFPEMPAPRTGRLHDRAPEVEEMPLALPFLLWPVAEAVVRAAPRDRPSRAVLDRVRGYLFFLTHGWNEALAFRGHGWLSDPAALPRSGDAVHDYSQFVFSRLTPAQRVQLGSVTLEPPQTAT